MEFTRNTGGPNADFANMVGDTLKMPGPRKEKIPTNVKKVTHVKIEKPPKIQKKMRDPFHGDIGVTRVRGQLNLSGLHEAYKKAIKSILKDMQSGEDPEMAALMADARKLKTSNVLVQELFAPLQFLPFEQPYERSFRMIQQALNRFTAMTMLELNPVEFPFEQK